MSVDYEIGSMEYCLHKDNEKRLEKAFRESAIRNRKGENMYAYVTQTKVEFYDRHIEAFERYSNSKTRIKGVFDIRGRSIEEVNISANHWDGTFKKLSDKLKEALKEEQSEVD